MLCRRALYLWLLLYDFILKANTFLPATDKDQQEQKLTMRHVNKQKMEKNREDVRREEGKGVKEDEKESDSKKKDQVDVGEKEVLSVPREREN